MAVVIDVPDAAWSTQEVSIAGITYTFVFRYNTTDKDWRLDLYQGETPIKLGLVMEENQVLLKRYKSPLFSHGELFCARIKNDGKPIGRQNFGIDLPYQLIYYSNSELGL